MNRGRAGLEEEVDRDGPQAPGKARILSRQRGVAAGAGPDIAALARQKVQALVTRHGLLTLVGVTRTPRLAPSCDPVAIAALAELAMAGDGKGLRNALSPYIEAGFSNSAILVDVLAPIVRLIGVYWEEDHCSFATTSIATALVQRVVYDLTDRNRRPVPAGARRALIAVAPGDQHTFAAVLISELLRAAGWFVLTRLQATENQLCADVAADRFSLIGFSLARTSLIDRLQQTILSIRAGGAADEAVFAVGGRVFSDGETTVQAVGADLAAVDGPDLIRLLDETSTFVAAD